MKTLKRHLMELKTSFLGNKANYLVIKKLNFLSLCKKLKGIEMKV